MAFIKLTKKQEDLKREVREFVKKELPPELAAEFDPIGISVPHSIEPFKRYRAKLGAKGWLVPWLPEHLGGIGLSQIDNMVLNEELLIQGSYAPLSLMSVAPIIIAPTLFRLGSEEQKKEYLPRIARGEIDFCVGYTEPESGTDLASLQMRAVEDGDDFIIDGQKAFNTHAHFADYHWLLVRTDPSTKGHRGLSLFIVDLKSPGITVRPVWCLGGERTNDVFYDNVRVPKRNLVGEKGQGFYYVMTALQFERSFPAGGLKWVFTRLVDFAQRTNLASDPVIRQKLAEMATEVEIAGLFDYRVAYLLDQGKTITYEVSLSKVYITECYHRLINGVLNIIGLYGSAADDATWSPFVCKVQQLYQRSLAPMIGGGTNDMLRSYAVTRGLGLPSAW